MVELCGQAVVLQDDWLEHVLEVLVRVLISCIDATMLKGKKQDLDG